MGYDQIRNAFVLIRCTKASHKNCKPVRNAVMKEFKNVLQSYTTDADIDGVRYCVACKALVRDSEVKKFERNLRRLKTGSKRQVGVEKMKMLVSQ